MVFERERTDSLPVAAMHRSAHKWSHIGVTTAGKSSRETEEPPRLQGSFQ
jgi:hypothetical protein